MDESDRLEEIETLFARYAVLERLCQSSVYIRDLITEIGHSRSTVNRAINELEAMSLVERTDDGVSATTTGRLVHERLGTFLEEFDDVRAADSVLNSMSPNTDVGIEMVAGCETVLGTDSTPYRPLERVHEDISNATRYRACLPTVMDPRNVRLLYEHVVTDGNPAEVVVTPETFRTLRQEFPRRMTVMSEAETFTVFVGSVPSFGLALLEFETGVGDRTTSAYVVVFDEHQNVHGLLVNDSPRALAWAESRYRTHREQATDRTNALTADPDGGTVVASGADMPSPHERILPVSIEREGFVHLDVSYFRDEPVAPPMTAWRAGLSLAEVHTGYAVERPWSPERRPSTETRASEADRSLVTAVTSSLRAGTDCIVVGPPGSGKSTLCKQVACRWYDDGGVVFYRESSRGHPFESVDALVRAATAAEGHTLVVVEDAVRPDATAIFEAAERLLDSDDVSVLLDAREHEWSEAEDRPTDPTHFEMVHVPPVRKADCERLLEQFERTTGRTIDVPAEQLWSTVREETGAGGESERETHEMFRVMHRLATAGDPLGDGPTAFEETVASVHEAVADDEVALSVCLLANTLNAAGVTVERGYLYAVSGGNDFERVDAAVDRLEGRILFAQDDGQYRTVHEEWSATFLGQVVDTMGAENASRRFGETVSALFSLADDPAQCARIGNHLDDQWALSAVVDGPQEWADTLAEAIYTTGIDRAKLAPLFGDGSHDSIRLAECCSRRVVAQRLVWLGEAFIRGGYYDHAERAFERLGDDEQNEFVGERLLGLARISIQRGEYDDARTHCHNCLAAGETDDRISARAQLHLGKIALEEGKYDDAKTHYRTALETFRDGGHRQWTARTLRHLGTLASTQSEYDQATAFFERSLDIETELGNRADVATTLHSLGELERQQGNLDQAVALYERSLTIKEELGDRPGVANTLQNLGTVHGMRSDYRRASAFYERALDVMEALGDTPGVGRVLNNLGQVESRQGNFERATAFYERSLDIKEELGDRASAAQTLNNLGTIAIRCEEYGRARAYCERALDIAAEIDQPDELARSYRCLAAIALREGACEKAQAHLDTALAVVRAGSTVELRMDLTVARLALAQGSLEEARSSATSVHDTCEQMGVTYWVARSKQLLGEIAVESNDIEHAREHFRDALDLFEEIGALHDALETLSELADTYPEGDDRLEDCDDRARELSSSASREVIDRHEHWLGE